MACYHPLLGIPDYNPITNKPYLTKNGKIKYRILKQDNIDKDTLLKYDDAILIPCGHCIGCRLEYSRQWANRLMLELKYHDSAYFVTLTYNNDHVPKSDFVNEETGEVLESLTLCKRDCQLFMKRLRKAFPDDKIRFYLCGEYGPETFRPHYHAIIFGLHLTDLKPWRYNHSEKKVCLYYRSDSLERCWSVKDNTGIYQPIGNVEITYVNWDTCAYTARYVTKKLYGDGAAFYEIFNLEPPFSLMSRKPGIGRQYYDDNPNIFESDYICLATEDRGLKFKPPKYYEKLFELVDPSEAQVRKETKKAMAKAALAFELDSTTNSYRELLDIKERAHEKRAKKLKRSVV